MDYDIRHTYDEKSEHFEDAMERISTEMHKKGIDPVAIEMSEATLTAVSKLFTPTYNSTVEACRRGDGSLPSWKEPPVLTAFNSTVAEMPIRTADLEDGVVIVRGKAR